jgi:Domain of unknown function (DUF4337)
MGSASKVIEHMGHAGEAPHHTGSVPPGSNLGMYIGATMASLGAILALFTVTASAARTELLGLYTQETIASAHAEASATKYRIVETQLRQLHAQTPDPQVVKSAEAELATIAATGPEAARAVTIARLAAKPILSGITPTPKDLARFVRLARGYAAEREAAVAWQKTFEGPKADLATAIEHYEWAELCAELGVVVSSLAILFSNRKVWLSTVALGAVGLVIFLCALIPTTHRMHAAEAAIARAKEKTESYLETMKQDEEEELFRPIESGDSGE